jgi:hypothetical protein
MLHRNRDAKSARVAVRLSPSLHADVSKVAMENGYASSSAFIRATIHSALNGRNPLVAAEEKTAAALERIRHDIQRLERSQQAAFALIDALVKTVLTCLPEPPTDVRRQAVVVAKERYEALLRTAANGIRGESRAAMRALIEVDGDTQ